VPAIPSWLLEPLRDQFAALLPPRPVYAPSHPLGCHRQRIPDRLVFEKLLQVLRFGCSYEAIAGFGRTSQIADLVVGLDSWRPVAHGCRDMSTSTEITMPRVSRFNRSRCLLPASRSHGTTSQWNLIA
jgi:hypothetical protein